VQCSFLFLLLVAYGDSFAPGGGGKNRLLRKSRRRSRSSSNSFVEKVSNEPVLVLVEPRHKTKVHLVGVSHGSPASAALVSSTMRETRPNAVVVELCDDRFISISLDAKIRPRLNQTLESSYDEKVVAISKMEQKRKGQSKAQTIANKASNLFTFIKGQGLLGGTFVLLGLVVSNLQKLTRRGSSTSGDEFVTAMKEAEVLEIPVILGDAPQNDTLASIRKVLSLEIFSPSTVVEGTLFFSFSAFGLLARESNQEIAKLLSSEQLQRSSWLNIPLAYMQNKAMLQGLTPILIISLMTFVIGFIPFPSPILPYLDPASSSSSIDGFEYDGAASAMAFNSAAWFYNVLFSELPEGIEHTLNSFIDLFSFLLLVRMSRLIGHDRDAIIAQKIQDACRDHPGQTIVVVIGMLHANGVARWLLSGADPVPQQT